ncbi:DUF6702 family protein [Altibacter sp. HG106]|uniref:DUF6702 family protein n=1 Tax=Altibacter sp. HG106 TaxID=3023937 RepID=UPI002350D300|nr:DUF6702 family protein [Altibacter sp. HG106]MDC7995881.1 hypothetical protein [Altibacter sp. HG106]
MKFLSTLILLAVFPVLLGAKTEHKFYVSVTKIEYAPKAGSLQIISNIFIDDLEDVLQQRYREDVSLATTKETEADETLLQQYILQKVSIQVDDLPVKLTYIGREYDVDMVKVYIEVEAVSNFESITIENAILQDLFEEQQNIVHVKKGKDRKSMILTAENPKGMLKFK